MAENPNRGGQPGRKPPEDQTSPQPPDAVGGPSDKKTPVADSGALPGPQGPRQPRQPGGQPNLPTSGQ